MPYKTIKHARDGKYTLCKKFISVHMETSEDYDCKVCTKRAKLINEMEHDVVYVTISGITYRMATRNLKRKAHRLAGLEYKVGKKFEGKWETYAIFEKNYGKKKKDIL